ncbi:MAG: stage V sporulation protein AD [Clostridia bacterium]|nr:stage V sporulation protein AD [Clostridia bacterium]
MPIRTGKGTISLPEGVYINSSAGVAGSKEKEGPLGKEFDIAFNNDKLGMDTWEKAESELQKAAVTAMLEKARLTAADIDVIFAGDLLNQCMSSTYGLRDFQIPLMCQFGACSTMAQTLAAAAVFVASGAAERAAAVTSSHFCTAERQFRMPIDYGGQRSPTAQWTVTGAGAALISRMPSPVRIESLTIGRINDLKVKDATNMGAAMAPAAADTLLRFLADTDTVPKSYDLILTGDLGKVGSDLFRELMLRHGADVSQVHNDCGLMIFDLEGQDVHSGGSGCGCSASVFCSHIMRRIEKGELKSVLFIATGALMSPTASQQGESIPSIAHLLHLSA